MKELALLLIVLALSACGGSPGDQQNTQPDNSGNLIISGGAIKGPLQGATLSIYNFDPAVTNLTSGLPIVEGGTNSFAAFENLAIPANSTLPLIIDVDGTTATDINSSTTPVITSMRTIITQNILTQGVPVYATPLTTIVLEVARQNADSNAGEFSGNGDNQITTMEFEAALPIASKLVIESIGFGMNTNVNPFTTPPLVTNNTTDIASLAAAAHYRLAIEAISALVMELQTDIANNTTTVPTTNELLMSLANDLSDGEIDGNNNGNIIDDFLGATNLTAILSSDISTLQIPNTMTTVGNVEEIMILETTTTGINGVNISPLDGGAADVTPEPIQLIPDSDGDGINNQEDTDNNDACTPTNFNNACSQDSDNDGTSDFNEGEFTDTDSDGLFDFQESSLTDTDSDGTNDQSDPANNNACIPNVFVSACTQDSDNDGITDFNEGQLTDTDSDGIFDYLESSQTDTDSDDTNDQADPANNDSCIPNVFVSACSQDTDSDGTSDFNEGEFTDTDNDGLFNYLESSLTDIDSDGTNDQADPANNDACIPSVFVSTCSLDTDGDGTSDFNEGMSDSDGDGLPDYEESSLTDTDSDGTNDQSDPANNDACIPNVFTSTCTQDTDDDGTSDFNEGEFDDGDGDGLFDYQESSLIDTDSDGTNDQNDPANNDACIPNVFTSTCTQDTDDDGTSDFNEGEFDDDDGDGLFDYQESSLIDTDSDGTNNQSDPANNNACIPSVFVSACAQDTDGDGTTDFSEGELIDMDSDGLFDYQESSLIDTDSDGTNDQSDPANNDACIPNVFVSTCTRDTDADGISDFNEGQLIDTDGDGLFDYQESSITDTDLDNTNDQADAANNDACIPNVFVSTCAQDTDGDGTSDVNEGELTDTDNDGLFDYQESSLIDTDSDGTNDQSDPANNDACVPNVFVSACTQDTDGDGTSDVNEGELTDTDNDGLLDYQESSLIDTDSDGTNNQIDPANNDACIPNVFVSTCTQDTDADGVTDFNEGQNTDVDGDGLFDYLESSLIDTDSDGSNNQIDPQNTNPCIPNVFVSVCSQDTDGDGVTDFNEGATADSDSDGLFDYQESSIIDTDGDGIFDQFDPTNVDPCIPSAFTSNCAQDTDGDGITDFNEGEFTDTDADGLLDYQESSLTDTDADGTNNQADTENNNACVPNVFVSACTQDTDGDGATDFNEGEFTDTDADGVPNYQESSIIDADNDGTSDQNDAANNNACLPNVFVSACTQDTDNDGASDFNEGQFTDTDNDGLFDYQESSLTDADADGTNDQSDPANNDVCVPSAFVSACSQDTDGDGASDFNEGEFIDTDSDGLFDYQESSLTDTDSDGTNDQADAANNDTCIPNVFISVCAQDTDGDGTTDFNEGEFTDTDSDGLLDYQESSLTDTDADGTNDQTDQANDDACIPNIFVSTCTQDTDNDGTSDFNEGQLTDTDGDGTADYLESSLTDTDLDGTNNQADPENNNACVPNIFVAACTQDTDGDGISDFNEGELTDSDSDGLFDYQESSSIDTDSDGINDQADPANNDACTPNIFVSACLQDTDADGVTDFNEGETIDTDADGIFDYLESSLTDTDSDGLNDEVDAANNDPCIPNAFVAACTQDTDGDGTSDFNEGELTDTDGDGLFDYQESSISDTDSDLINDQTDPANNDPCTPDMNATACTSNGIASRPSNTSCVAPEVPIISSGTIGLQRILPNVSFTLPVKALQAPNDNSYWYVLEQTGDIKRVANDDNTLISETYITTPAVYEQFRELGLLGMAFSPNWPATKEFYVYYTNNKTGGGRQSVVSRYVIADDTSLPATATEEIIMLIDQPNNNHNGGNIAFGNDGYLYIGLGDGGGPNDPLDYAQNTTVLLGSMLRIDVQNIDPVTTKYAIPPGNPFSGNAKCSAWGNPNNCPEIFAWGLRNPWRWSFDLPTNTIWAGDVGQDLHEEVNNIVSGGNFGWPCKEGSVDNPSKSCTAVNPIDPVYEYDHDSGTSFSVTGGFVYRGSQISSLTGRYLFADIYSGQIWALEGNPTIGYTAEEIIDSTYTISSFAKDNAGEHYILDFVSGGIYQLVSNGEVTDESNIPMNLADSDCVMSSNPSLPSAGMIPYEPNARFWSDDAEKSRWIAIPDNTTIAATENNDVWTYPPGTVTMKNFVVENKLIETRFYMHHPDGRWAGYSYEWNENETAATRVIGGKTRDLTHTQQPQQWIYPSEGECTQCHTSAAGNILGMSTAQLNRSYTYPNSGITDNQIETLNHINYFNQDLTEPVSILPSIIDPTNTNEDILFRAKAYLHTNCSSCHRPGSGVNVAMDLRYETPLNQMNICDVTPQRSDFGIANAKLIAPGDPSKSIILNRMNRRDNEGMPPIGSNIIDSDGVTLIQNWINTLSLMSCN